jgi:hypothetical protein
VGALRRRSGTRQPVKAPRASSCSLASSLQSDQQLEKRVVGIDAEAGACRLAPSAPPLSQAASGSSRGGCVWVGAPKCFVKLTRTVQYSAARLLPNLAPPSCRTVRSIRFGFLFYLSLASPAGLRSLSVRCSASVLLSLSLRGTHLRKNTMIVPSLRLP